MAEIVKYSENKYVQSACEFIEANYQNDITVTDIADHVAVDRTYLYRLFCLEKGVSPSRYLQKIRLEAAKRLIESGKYSQSDIPKLVGFHHNSRFAAMFKREYGVSPKDYSENK